MNGSLYLLGEIGFVAIDAQNEKAWTKQAASLQSIGFQGLESGRMQMTRKAWEEAIQALERA